MWVDDGPSSFAHDRDNLVTPIISDCHVETSPASQPPMVILLDTGMDHYHITNLPSTTPKKRCPMAKSTFKPGLFATSMK